jgi:tetratricopeptide (TPR) repeat protein
VLFQTGQLEEALETSSHGWKLICEVEKRYQPEDLYILGLKGEYYGGRGTLRVQSGHWQEALDSYQKSLEIHTELVQRNPAVPGFLEDKAKSHNDVGYILAASGRGEQAAEQYRQAIKIREPLVKEFPDHPEYARELVKNYLNLASNRMNARERVAGKQSSDAALALAAQLVTSHGDVTEHHYLLPEGPCHRRGSCFKTRRSSITH